MSPGTAARNQSGSPGWPWLVGALLALIPLPADAAGPAVDAEDLRPGLIATYRDPGEKSPIEIVLPEPTIALALKAGEAPHPRLRADGGTVRWQGYLNVLRAGSYRFSVRLRGKFRLIVAGKVMLAAEMKGERPRLRQGPALRLEDGVHPLTAEFTRLPGAARVELFWQAPHFYPEPLPFDVVGHLPKEAPPALGRSLTVEHGRFLAEEHNCTACHRREDHDRLANGLLGRQGPDLSRAGERLYAGWIYQWLDAPQKIRPGAAMPEMFTHDDAGRVERYAMARYLAGLGGPLAPQPTRRGVPEILRSVRSGKALFTRLGCIACHGPRGAKQQAAARNALTGAPRNYPLTGLGSKTTPAKLAAYLQNPLAIDPSGRMPHMLLSGGEAEDLARFLCADRDAGLKTKLPAEPRRAQMLATFQLVEPRREELAAFRRLPADAQWNDLGKRLVIDRGCNSCHTIAPGGKDFANVLAGPTFDDIKSPKTHARGCLAEKSADRGKAPWFALDAAGRDALRSFLAEGTHGAGSPAPGHAGRVTIERFNCLGCHSRDGEGSLSADLVERLRRYEKAENAEAVVPPPLTGVGHKLRSAWAREVLTRAGRARPWMGLRMPQFGEANVGRLPEALAALEGTDPDDRVHRVPLTAAKIRAGRRLVGSRAFGCIGCHDIAGHPAGGTRGPDLAGMNQRVRYDWYRRWLQEAQRMQPGTRMPTIFPGGKSTLEEILRGSADAQAEAIWAYLSLGPTLPLPEGTEPPPGLVLTVKDRPVLLRTFMPDAGSRAVTVGYPGGVAAVFDAQRGRLAYAWSGNFLDASPVWNDRGGNPARVLGARFWTAPPGCPWGLSHSEEPPDFAARARDPALGAELPEGKVFLGKRLFSFRGYAMDKEGRPTFRYEVAWQGGSVLKIDERPEPLRSPAGVGIARHFSLRLPHKGRAWLLAGETGQDPRVLNKKGAAVTCDLKSGWAEAAADRSIGLSQGGGKVVLLTLSAAPAGTRWRMHHEANGWKVLLRLPTAPRATLRLCVWAPYREEAGLLKELIDAR
jgi:mono/diheme cytochrome c family protein